jgi:hypothetical protein
MEVLVRPQDLVRNLLALHGKQAQRDIDKIEITGWQLT